MINIPFFNYKKLFQNRRERFLSILAEVLESGFYIMGPELEAFEAKLAEYTGARHAIGMADGTMALICGIKASGIVSGDEVLVPSHTFVATAAAVHHCGAIPVLVDCGRDHLICPESARRNITSKTKAIMPVQLNGRVANMATIGDLAIKHGLVIVEDSCQALGARFGDRQAGTFGKAGAFSFYPSKTLGCFGDGGAVVTNDDEVADIVRTLRDHGRSKSGTIEFFGYNSRLDNIQAAILLYKLSFYDEEIEARRRLARIYHDRLSCLGSIILPPGPDETGPNFDIYQNYEIEAEDRDALRRYLAENGIGTLLQWGGNVISQFDALNLRADASFAEHMTSRYMMLPMNTTLSEGDVHEVCDAISKFYRG